MIEHRLSNLRVVRLPTSRVQRGQGLSRQATCRPARDFGSVHMSNVFELRQPGSGSNATADQRRESQETGTREKVNVTLGGRIKEARKARGLNRNQVARAVGSSWALVNRWEKGSTHPSLDSLMCLSELLDVEVHELLFKKAAEESQALESFIRRWAPPDLSEAELRWLVAAPVPPGLQDRPRLRTDPCDVAQGNQPDPQRVDAFHPPPTKPSDCDGGPRTVPNRPRRSDEW